MIQIGKLLKLKVLTDSEFLVSVITLKIKKI